MPLAGQTQLPQRTDPIVLICWAVGGIVFFTVGLIVTLVFCVLFSQPNNTQDAPRAVTGQSLQWVLSLLFFSTITATFLVWKMESGHSALAQQMGSMNSALASKLDNMAEMMKRQHEESNMVMATTKLVTSSHKV